MARWLVTGATGCVGWAVVVAARRAGHEVRGLARRGAPIDFPAEVVAAAVEDAAAVERAAAGCDVVVHLASWAHQVPRTAAEVASLRATILDGSRNVASAAAAAGARLVAASTVAVFEPETPYGKAKLEAEPIVAAACPTALQLRIVHVYGEHDRGNMPRLMQAIDRRLAVVVGDGSNRKSMIFVDNLADRIVLAAAARELAGIFVAADEARTQQEIVSALARELGRRRPPRLPRAPLLVAARAIDLVARSSWADRVAKLSAATEFDGGPLDKALGYRQRVGFEEGIRRAVGWYRRA